jgi:hypothetical protein
MSRRHDRVEKEESMFRKLITKFKALSARISAGMAEVFEEEMRNRADHGLAIRHATLCGAVATAEVDWRSYNGLKSERHKRHLARLAAAIMELRLFLGQLTEGHARSIARALAQDYHYDDPVAMEERIYVFLRQESESADDASEVAIRTHADRLNQVAYGARSQSLASG